VLINQVLLLFTVQNFKNSVSKKILHAKMTKKKSFKRELLEWLVFITVIAAIYLTGLHTPIMGGIQNLVLKTGIVQPSTDTSSIASASYDFVLADRSGRTVSFDEFKGKTVFLNFWATWCPPCIAEMPDIDALYRSLKSSANTTFVMVATDEDFEKAIQFVDKKGYELPIFRLQTNVPLVFQSTSIPTTYVISPDGEVVMKKSGMAKYNTDKFRAFLSTLSEN